MEPKILFLPVIFRFALNLCIHVYVLIFEVQLFKTVKWFNMLKHLAEPNMFKGTVARSDLSATILFKLFDSYVIAFKFAQYRNINTKKSGR